MHASASTPPPPRRPSPGGRFAWTASLPLRSCHGPLPFPVSARAAASPWFPNDSAARPQGTDVFLSPFFFSPNKVLFAMSFTFCLKHRAICLFDIYMMLRSYILLSLYLMDSAQHSHRFNLNPTNCCYNKVKFSQIHFVSLTFEGATATLQEGSSIMFFS